MSCSWEEVFTPLCCRERDSYGLWLVPRDLKLYELVRRNSINKFQDINVTKGEYKVKTNACICRADVKNNNNNINPSEQVAEIYLHLVHLSHVILNSQKCMHKIKSVTQESKNTHR